MSTAIRQVVTVQPGGVIEVRSPELHAGDQAEVTVVVTQPTTTAASRGGDAASSSAGGWRRYAGAIDSTDARAGDNARIDADLADEYGGGSKAGT
jgi:hypothetical protein